MTHSLQADVSVLTLSDLTTYQTAWIDGRPQERSERSMPHFNPADASNAGETWITDQTSVDKAMKSARICFDTVWGRMPGAERKRLLMAYADLLDSRVPQLSQLETLEIGRPISDAKAINATAGPLIRSYANMIDRAQGDLFDSEERRLGVVWRRPRGVVAAITPWNVPVMNVLCRVAPALAAGNTIVVKPSENCPRTALYLARLACEAGLPAGLFNVVLGPGAETGNALASHADVNLVAFTGSTSTGMAIARAAAERSLKPVLLECGGKSPQVVLEDAFDDPRMWQAVFFSAFWNTSQWCVAKTRLLVPRGMEQRAIDGLQKAAAEWRIGDPGDALTRLGPLASASQKSRVEAYFAAAREQGEVVDLGCVRGSANERGYYAFPSLACGLPRASKVTQEEVFGPLMTIEAFDDLDDAIALANGTVYGLSASIWTHRSDLAFKLARSIDAGGISVYSSADAAKQTGPTLGTGRYFEPRKQSGYGVDGGLPGFLTYSTPQAVAFFN
ncbi:aldehyde dehydrogenase family protein [Ottowia thiooxydans]|uniref:Acyl-CoA reductase-like NAD-dependent aldehyde dehydrogenase n=1 Tax=Ottowia thiooxydans TaxID=219182 RepID=A0ABV2QE75_9BURK